MGGGEKMLNLGTLQCGGGNILSARRTPTGRIGRTKKEDKGFENLIPKERIHKEEKGEGVQRRVAREEGKKDSDKEGTRKKKEVSSSRPRSRCEGRTE